MGAKYQSQSASGYNASPPPDDGSTTTANKITWAGIKTKLADSLLAFANAINSQLNTALDTSQTITSSNYTTLAADNWKTVECTGTITVKIGDSATMGAGYIVKLKNVGSGIVTAAVATSADTLDGTANGTLTIAPGGCVQFKTNSSANGVYSESLCVGETAFTPTDASGASLTFTSVNCQYTKVGHLVTCWFQLSYPVTADGSSAKIGGLPFTSFAGIQQHGLLFSSLGPLDVATVANAQLSVIQDTSGAKTNASLSGSIIEGQFSYRSAA